MGWGTRDPGSEIKTYLVDGSGVRKSTGSATLVSGLILNSPYILYCRLLPGCRKKTYPGSGSKVRKSSGSATILNSPYLCAAGSCRAAGKKLIPDPGSGSRVRETGSGSPRQFRTLLTYTYCRLLPGCWAGWAAVSPPCCGAASPPRRGASSSWSA